VKTTIAFALALTAVAAFAPAPATLRPWRLSRLNSNGLIYDLATRKKE